MTHIYIPTTGPDDWQRLLALPDKHWRTGFSARTLAHCWEAAGGFPPEIAGLFARSDVPAFREMELLLAIPEHKVALPGHGKPSQTDLFALGKDADGRLAAIAVEGKVSESFGPEVKRWSGLHTTNGQKRLESLRDTLGLEGKPLLEIRYQLLHRTASAVIEAKRFCAPAAVMLVHSFSPDHKWFEDFQAFVQLFGERAEVGRLCRLRVADGVTLYVGWVKGDPAFLEA